MLSVIKLKENRLRISWNGYIIVLGQRKSM